MATRARVIAVVTTSRADYGLCRPVLKAICAHPELRLRLLVSGQHLSGPCTLSEILSDGFDVTERISMLLAEDSRVAVAQSIGMGTLGFAQALARQGPDLLLVLGDRFEMLSAVCAALPLGLPLAHIHGGELTYGSMDECIRHAITKMSHLHFTSTQEYADRVIQMGEEPWRVTVSGAPALDNLREMTLLEPEAFAERYGVPLSQDTLVVTFHPPTRDFEQLSYQLEQLLMALETEERPLLFTEANADPGGQRINSRLREFIAGGSKRWLVPSLGTLGYFSALRHCALMVGNSSSGILEAPSLGCPVVNIGSRQEGRVRGGNVIDVGHSRTEILEGISQASREGWRQQLSLVPSPYGDGNAAERIVSRLVQIELDRALLEKRFFAGPQARKA